MKVIIAGSRHYKDFETLKSYCDKILQNQKEVVVVSGKQVTIDKKTGEKYGADYLGEQYAKLRGYPVKPFPADWDKYGKPAGPIRNKQMAKYADALIAFWDGKSTGTGGMIELAKEYNLKIRIKYI